MPNLSVSVALHVNKDLVSWRMVIEKNAYVNICDCGIYTFFLTFILINQETYPFIRRHRVVSLPILLSELPLLNKLSAHSGACFDNWSQ